MELKRDSYESLPILSDEELMRQYLSTQDGSVWIELGCGDAKVLRTLAKEFPEISFFAYEVDEKQHDKNIMTVSTTCPKNLSFGKAGMQDFAAEDASVDAVVMLKSLHHVPQDLMQEGFHRISRALKPGGKLFISEPVFGGAFNDILRLFHDEEEVRSHAFEMTKDQVSSGKFDLETEIHCQRRSRFPRGFLDFEEHILGSTHTHHELSKDLFETVKEKFEKHLNDDGSAEFLSPMRIDILIKCANTL